MWQRMSVTQTAEADAVARKIIANAARYATVEAATGVPWFWIGCVHDREAGLSFSGVLHNGEKIIGTGRKTTLVPAGRGPFATWEDAAIDALRMRGLQNIKAWPIARCLYEFEGYNGLGYTSRRENSPYVWAGTSLEQPGKYVADGKFDPSADDKQLGCAAVLSRLYALDADVRKRLDGSPPIQTPPPLRHVPPAQQAPQWGFFIGLITKLFSKGK